MAQTTLSKWIESPEIVNQNIIASSVIDRDRDKSTPHFMGVDIGLKSDGTAITIGHWVTELVGSNASRKLEIDLATVRYPKNENRAFFEIDEIAEWVCTIAKRYGIQAGLTDQYYGSIAVPIMHKKGFKNIECRHFNRVLNLEAYTVLHDYLVRGNLRIPESKVLTEELLSLEMGLEDQNIMAPVGGHDDLSDSLARMAYVAHNRRPVIKKGQ
jgi:phage terminase large subunit-like protein